MAKTVYRSNSPYATTPQTSWYLELLNYRNIPADRSDKPLVLESKYEFRPHNLSYDLYGTKDFWWVFMALNIDLIRDPVYDFKTGILLFVPTQERLVNLLGSN